METIRKKICIDDFLSHRPGIMPYIKKDGHDNSIKYIEGTEDDSNYGNFPCDFVLVDSTVVVDDETGLSYRKNTELSRLRYLDILRMYNRYYEIINNGVIAKKKVKTEQNVEYLDCVDESGSVITESVTYRWITGGTEDVSIYDCIPVSSGLFYVDVFGGRTYGGEDTELLTYLSGVNSISGLTEEQQETYDTLMFMAEPESGVIYTEDYILIVDNYYELKKIENWWKSWWEESFSQCSYSEIYESWEKAIFDLNYEAPVVQSSYEERVKCYLKFLYDVEKYILGRLKVPENFNGGEIGGTRTPNYLYYLNYNTYKNWFEENSTYVNDNYELKKKWDSFGGDKFYNYLQSINPHFLNQLMLPQNGSITAITYAPPTVDIALSFINECMPEQSYKAYELSVDKISYETVDGTHPYYVPETGFGSALTPTFKTFEDGEVIVGSKLTELYDTNKVYRVNDEIYGIFDSFTNDGQLFDCYYRTGTSSRSLKERCRTCVLHEPGRRKNQNNEWEWYDIRTVNIPEEIVHTIKTEKMPKVGESDVYQIVGITIESETSGKTNIQQVDGTITLDDGTQWVASSYTYYDKTTTKNYSWWACKKCYTEKECGDGEDIDFSNGEKYRNLLLLSCVPSASETKSGQYCYLVKYDNGYTNLGQDDYIDDGGTIKIMKVPYTLGKKMNITSYDGEFSSTTIYDELLKKEVVDESGNSLVILEYVLRATSGANVSTSGIHYKEKRQYKPICTEKVVIDGLYDGEIIYEKIYKNETKTYSEDYNLYGKAEVAEITGMEIATQWTSASCINAYLFTEESSDNIMEYPNISVDISYNRGNAAAWEKRFKLSECNTIEDLENYGNNYFNIR